MARIIAMDTETQDGYAILITVPWAYYEPRDWQDCIDFLSLKDLREMACWNADYDCQAILKYLPTDVRSRLSVWTQAQHGHHKIKFVPHKFMKVWDTTEGPNKEKLLFTIYDMKQFYAMSLQRAAEKLGVQQKKEIPEAWLAQMGNRLADPKTRNTVLTYALGDAQTLQQIIDRTVECFRVAGLKFEKPFSNASFSERFFRKQMRYRRNAKVEKWARKAYFGGRIECLRAGHFPRAYFYDIHSAYPSIIANLVKPDGVWTYERAPSEIYSDCVYAFVDATVHVPVTERVGPIPIRKRGNKGILYPVGRFRRTLTLTEYKFLASKGWVVRIHGAWQHRFTRWHRPFSQIAELYKRRKADPRLDYAFKIVMNALYGKFAQVTMKAEKAKRITQRTQAVGGRFFREVEQLKQYTSFVYASEITAQIRMKLIADVDPRHVISYATDGIFTTRPVKIPTGPGLGEWSEPERVKDLLVIGSGVYQYESRVKGKWEKTVKFRGFSPSIDLRAMLAQAGRRHTVSQSVKRNSSLKLSTKRKEYRELNVLRDVKRLLNVNFDRKRTWPKRWNAGELTRESFKSRPKVFLQPIKFLKRKGVVYARMSQLSGKR